MATPPSSARPRARHAIFRTPLGRFLTLVGVVCLSGAVLGFAMAWPVSRIKLNLRTEKQLNQDSLAGSFDPEAAVASVDDLPGGWQPGNPAAAQLASVIGQPICGTTPQMQNLMSDPLVAVFQNSSGQETVVSQVFRFRTPRDANQYIQDLNNALSCTSFFTLTNAQRNRISVRNGQPDAPITDYVSKTLVASQGGARQFAVLQVGAVVIALTSVGPSVPPSSLLGNVQTGILNRVAPDDFPRTVKVSGEKPLPPEATTTSTAPPPTTTAPPPPSTTTTVKRRTNKRPKSTTPPATTAPATTVPSPAPPAGK